MCTASHNPKAYTGAKLVERGAVALSGRQRDRRDRGAARGGAAGEIGPGGGIVRGRRRLRRVPGRRAEVHRHRARSSRPRSCSTAATAWPARWSARSSSASTGLELVPTYWEPDGEFPDHEPNPLLPENREFIIRKVREEGADLGIAWDGDADRCFFIDETGEFVPGDFLTALLAESVLQKRPGAEILYDIRASRAVADTVEAAGGRALVNRVGHAFFKTRMRDEGGAFGGEVSGHYYFADFYNADSGTIPALLILELLGPEGRDDVRAARALPLEVLHLRRDQLRGRGPGREDGRRSRSATPTPTSASSTASRSTTTTGTSTCGRRTPSRCCASRSSRSSPRRTWRRSATRSCASSARDPHALDPDAVHGRAGQLLPDRGRPADAGRRRAELGQGAGRARARAGRPRPPDRGPRSGSSSPTSTSTTSAWSASSPAARSAEVCALDLLAPVIEDFADRRRARRRARRGADAAPRDPARRGHRAALGVALVPRAGAARPR